MHGILSIKNKVTVIAFCNVHAALSFVRGNRLVNVLDDVSSIFYNGVFEILSENPLHCPYISSFRVGCEKPAIAFV